MDKIKLPTSVGHREYGGQDQYWVRDADKNPLFYCIWGNKEEPEQISGLLNELAELRQVKESDLPFLVWAQSYIDPARWAGHRLDDAVKTELLERDTRLAQLRTERDALKARVEELDEVAAFWCFKCDVLARWFDAEQRRRPEWKDTTVQYDLRKFRDILGRFAASRRNTTPGGDE